MYIAGRYCTFLWNMDPTAILPFFSFVILQYARVKYQSLPKYFVRLRMRHTLQATRMVIHPRSLYFFRNNILQSILERRLFFLLSLLLIWPFQRIETLPSWNSVICWGYRDDDKMEFQIIIIVFLIIVIVLILFIVDLDSHRCN